MKGEQKLLIYSLKSVKNKHYNVGGAVQCIASYNQADSTEHMGKYNFFDMVSDF